MLILCTFCAAQNRSFKQKFIPKRSQNWVIFAKNAKIVLRFFSETSVQSHKFLHLTHAPPFWKFFIKYIEQWTKTLCKKTGWPSGQKPVDRPVNRRWFWNLPVGSGRENPDRFHLWLGYRYFSIPPAAAKRFAALGLKQLFEVTWTAK